MNMARLRPLLGRGLVLLALPAGCAFPGQVQVPRGSLEQEMTTREAALVAPQGVEAGQEDAWTRPRLRQEALRRHPALRALVQRARGKLAEASAAEGLPPPMAMAQLWQAPLRTPFLYGHGTMMMLGLQQSFPPGKARGAEARAALEEARMLGAELVRRERELIAQVSLLAVDLDEARARVALHEGHRRLLGELGDAARARQSTGPGVLLELARADQELASQLAEEEMARGDEQRARASLNLLLGRPPESPLELLPEEPRGLPPEPLAALLDRARSQNPEILAASAAAQRDVARAEVAGQMSGSPMYTVGVNYGWMGPEDPGNHTWGATFSMSLPWLAKGLGAAARARAAERDASRSEADDARLRVAQTVVAAHARAAALARRGAILQERLLPASRRTLDAARTGYITGASDASAWIDATHELREVELMLTSARADLDRSLLELELAVGSPLSSSTPPATTPKEAP